jgi:hypothetical protein
MNLKNTKLNGKIIEYLRQDCWKKSLMIDGKWGIGKTTTIKNFITNYSNIIINNNATNLKYTHYCKINGFEIDKDFDMKKYIVTNSFNLKTCELDPIFTNFISKCLNNVSNIPTPLKSLFKSISKNLKVDAKFGGVGISASPYNILTDLYNEHMEYVYYGADISKCIIIIDEIDRQRDDNLKTIFSKMIDVLENYNVKILFIVNSEELEDEKELMNLWYEKIFDFKLKMDQVEIDAYIPSEFSISFKKYITENIETFSNYRSYNKYLNFLNILYSEFASYKFDNNMRSIIDPYKELLFYNIFLQDNSNYFESPSTALKNDKEVNKKTKIALMFSTEIDQFIGLNYKPLFDKINKEYEIFKNERCEINNLNNKFLKSHYMCHRPDNPCSIDDPLSFLLNCIKEYRSYLDVSYSTCETHRLSYWILNVFQLTENYDIHSELCGILMHELKNYYSNIDQNNKDFLIESVFMTLNHMTERYTNDFKKYEEILLKITNSIEQFRSCLKELIFTNIKITDSDNLLNYYMLHYPDTLEIIINKSEHFIEDLRKLKKINLTDYKAQKELYKIKYPTENLRPINDWMLEIC